MRKLTLILLTILLLVLSSFLSSDYHEKYEASEIISKPNYGESIIKDKVKVCIEHEVLESNLIKLTINYELLYEPDRLSDYFIIHVDGVKRYEYTYGYSYVNCSFTCQDEIKNKTFHYVSKDNEKFSSILLKNYGDLRLPFYRRDYFNYHGTIILEIENQASNEISLDINYQDIHLFTEDNYELNIIFEKPKSTEYVLFMLL